MTELRRVEQSIISSAHDNGDSRLISLYPLIANEASIISGIL